MRPDLERLITKEEAFERIREKWKPERGVEEIPLTEAAGRILSENQYAKYDLPVYRASTMDGVAVKSEYFKGGMPDTSGWKQGVDFVRADTGDDFDDAYDAVIAIENVELTADGGLKFRNRVNGSAGTNVKPQGSNVRKGSLLVPKGAVLDARKMAAIAMGGNDRIPVYKKPRIAFVPTGSELVPPGTAPGRGQNIDTNSVLVRQMLLDMGAEPLMHPIIRDDPAVIEEAFNDLLPQSDVILLNAGTSKGQEDYCARLLEKRGEILFQGIRAVPGRPMNAAIADGKLVVNLSGPAYAAFFSMDYMIRRVICYALGIPFPEREKVTAALTAEFQKPPFFSLMAAMHMEETADGKWLATPLALRGPRAAGSAAALTAEGVYLTEPGEAADHPGDEISVELLDRNRFL